MKSEWAYLDVNRKTFKLRPGSEEQLPFKDPRTSIPERENSRARA